MADEVNTWSGLIAPIRNEAQPKTKKSPPPRQLREEQLKLQEEFPLLAHFDDLPLHLLEIWSILLRAQGQYADRTIFYRALKKKKNWRDIQSLMSTLKILVKQKMPGVALGFETGNHAYRFVLPEKFAHLNRRDELRD